METRIILPLPVKILQAAVHLPCLFFTAVLLILLCIQEPLNAQSSNEPPDLSNDWSYNPFNSNSAWHRPIGTNAIYADDTDTTNIIWQQARGFRLENRFPYGASYGIADETSPVVTITHKSCAGWNTNPSGNRFPITLRIPSRANFPHGWQRIADCQDGHATIIDRTTGQVRDFYEYDRSDTNNITASIVRGPYYIDGLGHGSTLGQRVGNTATGYSMLGGALRPWEVMKTGHRSRLTDVCSRA